jgi:GDP-4-dehydro-6-deoxy-D-mannose reductase
MTRQGLHLAVVGGRGWLGRAVVAEARRQRMTVTVVSRRPGPGTVAVDPDDTSSLATALARADVVVNAAGNYRLDDAKAATVANYEIPNRLGWLAAHAGWGFVHVGSAAEYGPAAAGPDPIGEDERCLPRSIYGLTKLAGSRAVLRWREQGANAVVARVFNVVDSDLPRENPFHGIAAQVRQAVKGAGTGEVGIGDPTTTRDVSRRPTVAAAIVALATHAREVGAAHHETPAEPLPALVNVCSGRSTTFGDLATAIAQQLGVRIVVRDLGWPRGGQIVGDPTRLRSLVGFPYVDRLPDLARSILGTGGDPGAPSSVPQSAGDRL